MRSRRLIQVGRFCFEISAKALESLQFRLGDRMNEVRACRRALCIHATEDLAVVGRAPLGGEVWVWNEGILRRLDINPSGLDA